MKHIRFVGTVLCIVTGCGGSGAVTGLDKVNATAQPTLRILEIASGDRTLTVKLDASSYSSAAVSGYEYSVDGAPVWTAATSSISPITIAGLTNGTAYQVRVRAVVGGAAGEPSDPVSGTPMTVPGAPAIASVAGEAELLRVSFSAPSDNGGASITGYEYTLDGGAKWLAPDSLASATLVIGHLKGREEFTVAIRAINRMGSGSSSVAAKAFLLAVADAPVGLDVVPGDGAITIRFSAPAFTGGKVISAYEYSLDSGATWKSSGSSATSISVAGLVNGSQYRVAVRAVTETGSGHASATVSAVPFVVAPAVEIIRASRRPGQSSFVPQRLDMSSAVFSGHAARALQRYRALNGRDAVTQFEKVRAAADYVANMAKHPYRHNMNSEVSDPRAWEFADFPEKLAELATENQSWDGTSWEPSAGKTILDVPPLECTFQNLILGGIVNVLGLQWMIVSISYHDAFAYYDLEASKWTYIDATFNEFYVSANAGSAIDALSPLQLHEMSIAGDNSMVSVRNEYQPFRWESDYYLLPYSSMHPFGFGGMAVSLNGISVGSRNSQGSDVRVLEAGSGELAFAAQIAQGWHVAGSDEDIWAPQGETYIDAIEVTPRGNVVRLSTNLAVAAPSFERSVNGGAWTTVAQSSEIDGLTGEIRFRARYFGIVGGEVIIRQAAK